MPNYAKIRLTLMGACLALSLTTFAQNEKSSLKSQSNVRIRVVEKENGKTKITEKSFELPSGKLDDQVDKILDSLKSKPGTDRRISVTIEQGDTRSLRDPGERAFSFSTTDPGRFGEIKSRTFSFRSDSTRSKRDSVIAFYFDRNPELRKELDRVRIQIDGKQLRRDLDVARTFKNFDFDHGQQLAGLEIFSANEGKIKGLNVYSNKPADGTLNVRFKTVEKGNVDIVITDLKDKEIGRKTVKDFQGEYVGQIELKKNASGVIFVKVTQNDDGTVKRVSLPESK